MTWSRSLIAIALGFTLSMAVMQKGGAQMACNYDDERPCGGPMMGHGPGMMHRGPMMGGRNMHNPLRHRYFMMNGAPELYRDAHNPLPWTNENVDAGGRLYAEHCATCHGTGGLGNGPGGQQLDPPPINLKVMIQRPISSDPYLLWTIREGGAPTGTAMPAFKDVLNKQEIWQVVHYLRAGLPVVATQE